MCNSNNDYLVGMTRVLLIRVFDELWNFSPVVVYEMCNCVTEVPEEPCGRICVEVRGRDLILGRTVRARLGGGQ